MGYVDADHAKTGQAAARVSDGPLPGAAHATLLQQFRTVRRHTDLLVAPLSDEDQGVQSMPDASPAKWHRAHTTWFFEQFVLVPHLPDYAPFDRTFGYLFNSYYETVGARHPRPARGLLTRPGAQEVGAYRAHVDAGMERLLDTLPDGTVAAVADLIVLGLQHEQQHQELIITDTLHAFAQTPLFPAVQPGWQDAPAEGTGAWVSFPGGIVELGHEGPGFAFDNESPRHEALLRPYRLSDRLVSNADWLAFMRDDGYRRAAWWMSDGWAAAQATGWIAPLYWRETYDGWAQMGPGGLQPLVAEAPVRHISWYEADAFARWAGARLPTESEWEAAAADGRLADLDCRVWQWTASAYSAYPGFRPPEGAVGEYNGKFMINQMVLRGGSWATPPGHARPTYRNFFHPDKRWQFSGLRLAQEA